MSFTSRGAEGRSRMSLGTVAVLLLSDLSAFASSAEFVNSSGVAIQTVGNSRINELSLDVTQSQLRTQPCTLRLKGRLEANHVQLTAENKDIVVQTNDSKNVVLEIPFDQPSRDIRLVAIDPKGNTSEETKRVDIGNACEASWQEARKLRAQKRWSLVPSSGFSWISYQETNLPNYQALALTIKSAGSFVLIPGSLELGGNVYFNLLPISIGSGASSSARYLGLNLRLGYLVPREYRGWKLTIMGGVYFTQMIVPNGAFGYGPLLYPQFYPVARYQISDMDRVAAYLKLVPIFRKLSEFSLTQGELGLGGSLSRRYQSGRVWSLSADVSWMGFNMTETIHSETRTITFSIGTEL